MAARTASRQLAKASADARNRALREIASHIRADAAAILAANERDVAAARDRGIAPAMLDRLVLDPDRLENVAAAVDSVADLPEVVGGLEDEQVRPNGLRVAKKRIPLGVVAMIYESRPNVTTDAAALCIKSGNAVILRGGSEAFHSNRALGAAARAGLAAAGLPEDAVSVLDSTDRDAMRALLTCEDHIDLVIPRGGEGLIRFVAEHSRIPVLKHYKGVCHVYVHERADQDMALSICENAKVSRPGVCNAAETILVDRAIAEQFVPKLAARFAELGVEMRCDERASVLAGDRAVAATDADFAAEFLAKVVSIAVVDDFDSAVAHIERFGSDHTEAIVTADEAAAARFLEVVNSSTVVVNASTRFADGGELGLGAEIGISTTKLHAYGPMGAEGLTTTKFVVEGTGQVRT